MSEAEFLDVLNTAAAHSPETAAIGAGGFAIAKILGPSVGAVGRALGDWTDYRLRNLLGLESKVALRLEAAAQDPSSDEGTVHPRVAREILDEGSWIDDDLHQEYLAGIFVGARTKDGASDRAAYLARLVTGLTSDQVRLHYAMVVAYEGYWDGLGDCPFPFSERGKYNQHAVRIEVDEAVTLFPGFDQTARGLLREGLLQDFGRPRVALGREGLDPVHTSLTPSPLAFDVYLHALARPGRLGDKGLMLSRGAIHLAGLRDPTLRVKRPDPEPTRFATAEIVNLNA